MDLCASTKVKAKLTGSLMQGPNTTRRPSCFSSQMYLESLEKFSSDSRCTDPAPPPSESFLHVTWSSPLPPGSEAPRLILHCLRDRPFD